MDNTKNALAELAERLAQIAEVERESAVFHGDPLDASEDIDKAQRIVAELAKADIGEIHMAATLPKGGRQILSCIDEAVWNATDIVETCRAIAEEGGES